MCVSPFALFYFFMSSNKMRIFSSCLSRRDLLLWTEEVRRFLYFLSNRALCLLVVLEANQLE